MVLESEYIKRMKQMNQFMKGQTAPVFEDLTFVVNSNNPLVKNILSLTQTTGKEALVKDLCEHVYDLARMSQQPLSGEQMQAFVQRSNTLMTSLSEK